LKKIKLHPLFQFAFLSIYTLAIILLLVACENSSKHPAPKNISTSKPLTPKKQTGFKLLPAKETGITFNNKSAEETASMNCFNFFNIYNGGGVAIGDINNDNLPDIYFTGNDVSNRLYLNQGNFKFKDITETAKVSGESNNWTTGVTMADVNGDGYLDIYVCLSGGKDSNPEHRANLLFINNKDLTFTEQAKSYGINDQAFSNHASFFDYDKDGDLDLYVLNHPADFGDNIRARLQKSKKPSAFETDKLYKNNGDNTFTDITQQAGLINYGFGLSVSIADVNNDTWPDIFVANDYSEPDHLYINTGKGTFEDKVQTAFPHISQFSMGSDIADINNDGLQDILVVDMIAESNRRKKTNMSSMQPEAFYQNVQLGRHFQYMQNMLHLNNGNGSFSDIAEMAGISNTDWSWAPLFCDLDNDGLKDIFITNGMRRDIRNNDFVKKLKKLSHNQIKKNIRSLVGQIPTERVANYAFQNKGDLTFQKSGASWGLNFSGYSNGSAYADLDQDGDLDLVVNNLDDIALIYKNTIHKNPKYIQITLKGSDQNSFALGAQIKIETASGEQFGQLNTNHGFLSSSDPTFHFGLGNDSIVKQLSVQWPNGKTTILSDVPGNQKLVIHQGSTISTLVQTKEQNKYFKDITEQAGLNYTHQESGYFDYENEKLLPHLYSRNGPFTAVGDVDKNGLEDFYVGGAAGYPGALYLQNRKGKFFLSSQKTWEKDSKYEDMKSLFFDYDQDGDLDLYVVSGSNEWPEGSPNYQDRLYKNNGKGVFEKTNALPEFSISGSSVISNDIDNDGDLDLFIGGRLSPQKYPNPANSLLLINEKGRFIDRTSELAPSLFNLGMVTDASFSDLDGDGDADLLISGEWMPLTLLYNESGSFINKTGQSGLDSYTGWWYSLNPFDFDGDGDLDFIAGNLGLNSKYKVKNGPLKVLGGDLDKNGKSDIVLAYHENGTCYPVRGKQCSSQQMPGLNKKFKSYQAFANASLQDIYGDMNKTIELEANHLQSSYIENLGNGKFHVKPLSSRSQISPILKSISYDVNSDGNMDVIYAGNMYSAEIETCRHDASIGGVLLGDGKGNFSDFTWSSSGFLATGDVKDIQLITGNNQSSSVLISRNSDNIKLLNLNP